jgi:hypothetical protein
LGEIPCPLIELGKLFRRIKKRWCDMNSLELIIPKFLEIYPEFQQRWKEHLNDWDGESPGYYLDLAEFARFLVDQYESNLTNKFAEVFDQIERFLMEGDEEIKGIITVGLLEDIQTIASNRSFGYSVFEKWLGVESKKAWLYLEEIWEGKSSLMDVIRSEQ